MTDGWKLWDVEVVSIPWVWDGSLVNQEVEVTDFALR